MIRALPFLLSALFAQCTPGPTPSPTPQPTVTVPEPPSPWDSGAPQHATCEDAYSRQFLLGCPPAEDAHFGWRDIDCPRLTQDKINTIASARSCKDTR